MFSFASLSPSLLRRCCIYGEINVHIRRRPASGPPAPARWNKSIVLFPLSWWLVVSGLHWWWLFIVVVHARYSRSTSSGLTELTQIRCSGTEYSIPSQSMSTQKSGLDSAFVEPASWNTPLVSHQHSCMAAVLIWIVFVSIYLNNLMIILYTFIL